MTCPHDLILPNPAGGAWYCAQCGAYPMIAPKPTPTLRDCAVHIDQLRVELAEAQARAEAQRREDER